MILKEQTADPPDEWQRAPVMGNGGSVTELVTADRMKHTVRISLTASSYLLLSWLGKTLFPQEVFIPLWPAAGLAVALLLRFSWSVMPGVFLGALLTEILAMGTAWPLALATAVGNTLSPLVAAIGVRLYSKGSGVLADIQGTIVFILWGVLIHGGLTASAGVAGRLLPGLLTAQEAQILWLRGWLSHAAGTILTAPLLLCWLFPRQSKRQKTGEYLFLVLATLALSVWIFYYSSHFFMGLPYLLIVPLAWSAIRFTMARTMLMFVLFIVISASGAALVPSARAGVRFPLLHIAIVTVTYGITLLVLGVMKQSRDEIISALRANKEEADRYFNSSLDLLCVADTSGRFLRLNPEWEKTLGYSLDELQGKLFLDLVHPEDQEATRMVLSELSRQHEVVSFENRYRCRDGSYRWIEWRSRPQGEIINAAARDVTDRKKAEEALANERRQLLSIFDSIDHAIYVADMDSYEVLYANKALIRSLKANPVGNLCYRELQNLSQPCPFCTNQIIREKAPLVHNWEFHNTNINGYYDIYDRVIRWPDGRNVRFEMAIDITEKKQAEETIRQINEQLQIKNKELEQVIYVASHDLRSPLVNIDGYSRELGYALELIQKGMDVCPKEQQEAAAVQDALEDMRCSLGYIRRSAAQMDLLLSGLLRLSRSGRAALHIVPLDMNELVAAAIEGLDYQVRSSGALVTVDPLPPCMGDRTAVSQIVTNLIGNALKYLDPTRSGRIRIGGGRRDGKSVYTVEDNGIGIDKAHQEKIFEVFHRLNPGKYPGEGLGLTIVRQTLERLGGSIAVDSAPNAGSRFIAALPGVEEK